MCFDPQVEPAIPLELIPEHTRWIPPRREGRPLHPRTPRRWWLDGVRGADGSRVYLEVIRIGRTPCTSEAALKRFFAKLAHTKATPSHAPTRRQREREIAAAERELAGGLTPQKPD